jgi:prepilin-type N-terminal cleavage/methylation domain-containing protein
MVKRYAFTLIELIFAIVIIAISVLALPMMTQVTSKAISSNLVQEAIFAASAELNGVVAAHWDENSMIDDPNSLARVIDVDDNCSNYRLIGHINQPLHRRCLNDSTIKPKDSADDDEIFALEDLAHPSENIFESDELSAQGYKQEYNSTVDINRSSSFGNDTKNMKEIKLTVTNEKGDVVTRLKSFSANIGEVDYFKKVY